MIYKYKNEYYILRSRKLSKVKPVLTETGGLTFESCGVKIALEDCDVTRFEEVSTDEIKKELKRPVKIETKVVEEKPIKIETKDIDEKSIKVNKINKII